MIEYIHASLEEARTALENLTHDETSLQKIDRAAAMLVEAFESGGTVFSCGNGGSMSDAIHFSEELSGRYRKNRRALRAQAISDVGHITCTANDFGYEYVFSRYLEAHGKAGDVLLAISTSGKSINVLNAVKVARLQGLRVISLTGVIESALGASADLDLCTPGSSFADRVQELHIKIIHILIELVERKLFPENY